MQNYSGKAGKNKRRSLYLLFAKEVKEFLTDIKKWAYIGTLLFVIYWLAYSGNWNIAFAGVTLRYGYIVYVFLVVATYAILKYTGLVRVGEDNAFISLTTPFIILVNLSAAEVPAIEVILTISLIGASYLCYRHNLIRIMKCHDNKCKKNIKWFRNRIRTKYVTLTFYTLNFCLAMYLLIAFAGAIFWPNAPSQLNAYVLFPENIKIETNNDQLKYKRVKTNGKSKEEIVRDNLDKLSPLADTNYSKVSLAEKMEAMQLICNIECSCFGCEEVPEVISDNREDEKKDLLLLGFYSRENDEIWINPQSLYDDRSCTAMRILFHEIAHVIQHEYVENKIDINNAGYIFSSQAKIKAEKWKEEFDHYISGKRDCYNAYKSQECEKDAELYGRENIVLYYKLINSYSKAN